jgi:hypothetical protein
MRIMSEKIEEGFQFVDFNKFDWSKLCHNRTSDQTKLATCEHHLIVISFQIFDHR